MGTPFSSTFGAGVGVGVGLDVVRGLVEPEDFPDEELEDLLDDGVEDAEALEDLPEEEELDPDDFAYVFPATREKTRRMVVKMERMRIVMALLFTRVQSFFNERIRRFP